MYSCAVTSRSGTYAFIHDNEVFILTTFPSFYFKIDTSFLLIPDFLELLQESDIILVQKSSCHRSHISKARYAQVPRRTRNPPYTSGSIPHISSTCGCTIPQPRISIHPEPFTETASFSSAFETAYIHLCAGLGEREVMRTEFRLRLRSRTALLQTPPVFLSGLRKKCSCQ